MKSTLPIALQAGEGAPMSFANIHLHVKADSNTTNGHCAVFEYSVPAAFSGPALHYHSRMEEIFYVLEGVVTFQVEHKKIEAREGAFMYIPAGTVHTFSNPSDTPARMLIVNTPGGFEGYFSELAALMDAEATWPPADMNKLWDLLAKYDTFPADKSL